MAINSMTKMMVRRVKDIYMRMGMLKNLWKTKTALNHRSKMRKGKCVTRSEYLHTALPPLT